VTIQDGLDNYLSVSVAQGPSTPLAQLARGPRIRVRPGPESALSLIRRFGPAGMDCPRLPRRKSDPAQFTESRFTAVSANKLLNLSRTAPQETFFLKPL